MIHTKSLQNWIGIRWTGVIATEKITLITPGKICTREAREEPFLSQMTAISSISVIQNRRNFTTGGHHLIVMWGAMMTGGFPHSVTEEEMEIDSEKGLGNTLKTGGGLSTLP